MDVLLVYTLNVFQYRSGANYPKPFHANPLNFGRVLTYPLAVLLRFLPTKHKSIPSIAMSPLYWEWCSKFRHSLGPNEAQVFGSCFT